MRLPKIANRLLASAAIFGLSLAKPSSAQDEKAKRYESGVIAPKVFIIDMVGLTVLSLHAILLRGCYSFPLKERSGTASQNLTYWNTTSLFLVYRHCTRTFIVPAMERSVRSLPGRAVCTQDLSIGSMLELTYKTRNQRRHLNYSPNLLPTLQFHKYLLPHCWHRRCQPRGRNSRQRHICPLRRAR